MVKINKLVSVARTTEVDTVSDRLIIEYNKNDWSSDSNMASLFTELKNVSDRITAAINRIKAESTLEEKDELRDGIIKSINYLVMGYLYHPDNTIKEAAAAVNEVFENYGLRIISESYSTESSLIESLLLDFQNEALQPSIEAIPQLTELISNLRTIQTEFEEAKVAFENEKAAQGNEASATELKKEVLSVINNKIIVYLRAMVLVNEAVYGSFAQNTAQIIDDMNSIVRKRINNPPSPTEEEGEN